MRKAYILLATLLFISIVAYHHTNAPAPSLPVHLTIETEKEMPSDNEEWQKVISYESIEQPWEDIKKSDIFAGPPNDQDSFASIQYNQDHGRRRLDTQNSIDSPAIISFNHQDNSSQEYYAYKYIFTHLYKTYTQFIVYPYSFNYTSEDTTVNEFKKGAVLSLKPENLPGEDDSNYFNFLNSTTDVEFGKAKALYDIHIAILKLDDYYEDIYQDLTYEDGLYCSLLSSYLGKYSECMTGDGFLQFTADASNGGRSALVYVNEENLNNNILVTADGKPLFGMLIIPDYKLGSQNMLIKKLGPTGISKIKAYVRNGGKIFASGKGGYLLQLMGVIPEVYAGESKTLFSQQKDNIARFIGCGGVEEKGPEDDSISFIKHMLCMNITGVDGLTGNTFALSTLMMNKDKQSEIDIYTYFDPTDTNLKTKDLTSGLQSVLTEDQKSYLPLAFSKEVGNGIVFVMNANPIYYSYNAKVFYNYLIYAMSKNIVLDYSIGSEDNLPIPGGEAGIQMNVNVSFLNLYSTPISDFILHIWFPFNVVPKNFSDGCSFDPTGTNLVDLTGLDPATHIKCTTATVDGFERKDLTFKFEITDQSVTQVKTNILIARPVVQFTEDNIVNLYDSGGLRTSALLAALLRGAINPDPSSFYPIKGRGQYVDNVLQVENKEDSNALNSTYYGLVPLVSPVVDGTNQKDVSRAIRFIKKYYADRNYVVPFTNTNSENYDYIDIKYLSNKDVILVAEWDVPVKIGKEERSDDNFGAIGGSPSCNVVNMNYSTTIDNINIVLKQLFYDQADKLFEHATQRLMVFADTSKEEGAKLFYGDTIPVDEQNPDNPNVAKKELLWTRLDVYFYKAQSYQNPVGLNFNHVITVDKYPLSEDECETVLGNTKATIRVQGHFTHTEGLKPNEWDNELLRYCKTKLGLEDVEALSSGAVTPIHYIVPVIDEDIKQASNIMGFIQNEDKTGYLENYPEVKFTFGHSMYISVDAAITRQGGKFVITLPANISFDDLDPIAKGYITYSADQVAFYKTEYDSTTNVIKGYFKRGLMPNEAYGKASFLQIMLEHLNSSTSFIANVEVHEMKYDISAAADHYETYSVQYNHTQTFTSDRFFVLPAVQIKIVMNRQGDESIFAYELLEPFARFGVYIQELGHRTVYSFLESHHTTDPGLQSINSGFALISNLGISSVPFAEYVMTGELLIPSAPTTSRLEWNDIWGRSWAQPLRSVFPDVPPIPPPLRNFIMTTTFQLFKNNTDKRVMNWQSDEKLDIHVQLKFLNNYPKYFQITTCKDNEIAYLHTKDMHVERNRIFDVANPTYPYYSFQINSTDVPNNTYHMSFGHRSVYGMCFNEDGTILKGQVMTEEERNTAATAYLCADKLDPNLLLECIHNLTGMPTVSRRPTGTTSVKWNYSPKVERYYPTNYIKDNMWDMTHYDYDDNAMDKAYKYHCDNNIPGIDFGPPWNLARYQPQNMIAQPIFKGFGYKITYDRNQKLKLFPNYTGWWSDNLQNKDNTLVAGQEASNDISVGKPTLLPDSMWINAKDLKNPLSTSVIPARLKNIYTCLFNQHRVRLTPNQQRYAYLGNVYQNNIVPVIPELEKNDPQLKNFDCTKKYQYSPYNISQVDNIVETPTDRDWLYFAANLRGGARENINVPYSLSPLSGSSYEGLVKVQDGGRFVYWNPVNGINSYLMVDNPVNVVEAVRSDLSIEHEVFPKITTTFNAEIYHLFTISDKAEIGRTWNYETYTNNYGFGDATISIFVGGTESSVSTVPPGKLTFVKLTFYNNAGFDWNMKSGAIDFQYVGSEPINANDLLYNFVHTIQAPTSYNFLISSIPDEIKDYIELKPSDHNIDVAPQLFDFENINVVKIRDGFKGDYFYKLSVKANFPAALMGKVYEIKMSINESCFEALPGYNDPTGNFHDYKLLIPSIKFGVPYPSGHEHEGLVYYTNGYSTNLTLTSVIPKDWVLDEARPITLADIDAIRLASGDPKTMKASLSTLWSSLSSTKLNITSKVTGLNRNTNISLGGYATTFPIKDGANPDIAKVYILMKMTIPQLPYGTMKVISSPTIYYNTSNYKIKNAVIPAPLDKNVESRGAWLQVSYSGKIVDQNEDGSLVDSIDQNVFPGDTALYRANMTLKNKGTDIAYSVNISISYIKSVQLMEEVLKAQEISYSIDNTTDVNILNIDLNQQIAVGEFIMIPVAFNYTIPTSVRRNLASTLPSSFTFINSVSAEMSLTATPDSTSVVAQSITTPLKISVIQRDRDIVRLEGINTGNITAPVIQLNATPNFAITLTSKPIRYTFYRKISKATCGNVTCTGFVEDPDYLPIAALSSSNTYVDTLTVSQYTNLSDILVSYKVETIDEKKKTLASNEWMLQDKELLASTSEDPVGFPMYAIVIIIVGGLSVMTIVMFIVLRRRKAPKITESEGSDKLSMNKEATENPVKIDIASIK